mgnify:CR=1 FL=1
MKSFLYWFFMVWLAIALEALLRNIGLFLPLTAFSVFYFTSARGYKIGITTALIAGFLLDSIFCFSSALSSLFLLFAVLAVFIVKNAPKLPWFVHYSLTGMLLAVSITMPLQLLRGTAYSILNILPNLAFMLLLSAIFFPLYLSVADSLSNHLSLPVIDEKLNPKSFDE